METPPSTPPSSRLSSRTSSFSSALTSGAFSGAQYFGASEKNAVLFDFGSRHLKVGFGSEVAPRFTLDGALIHPKTREIISPYRATEVPVVMEAIELALVNIYFRFLQANPKDRKVIVCEHREWVDVFKTALKRVFFEKLKVPSLLFVPLEGMSSLALDRETVLVVDMGYESVRITPIYNTVTFSTSPAYWSSNIGMKKIKQALSHRLKSSALIQEASSPTPHTVSDVPEKALEDLIVRAGAVAAASDQSVSTPLSLRNLSSALQYDLPNSRSSLYLFPSLVHEVVTQVLFGTRDNLVEDVDDLAEEENLSQGILNSLLLCPIDCRAELCQNLALTGGLASLPGIRERLLQELDNLLQTTKYEKLKGLRSQFRFSDCPIPTSIIPWAGASLLGMFDEYYTSNAEKNPHTAASQTTAATVLTTKV